MSNFKKIRVLHIGLSPNHGGIESIVHSWWENADKKIVHFDFLNVYHESIAFEKEFKEGGSLIYSIPARKENPIVHNRELKRVIEEGNYDFLHCHVMSLSEPEPVMICINLKIKTKVIFHSHTVARLDNMPLMRKILHTYGGLRLRKYDYLKVACGQEAGKEMFHSSDFIVIENGINIDKFRFSEEKRKNFREKYGIAEKSKVIGHVGRLDKVKNYPFIIETFSLVKKMNPDAILLLIGDINHSEEINDLLIYYNVVESTVLTGKITSTENCYSAMDVFMFPSIYEGISVSMIEAQASGLECVVSENIAHESAISDYVHFMPIDNAYAMADKVNEYLMNEVDNRDKRKVDENYNIEKSTQKLIKFYYDQKGGR